MHARQHWEHVYATKPVDQVSWFQPHAESSLRLIQDTGVAKSAPIVDIGGGASVLVDDLLAHGYSNVSVLDISGNALARSRDRLAERAAEVQWIESDVLATPHDLDGTADLVYTGRGSLVWLQDLDAWAAVVARLLSRTGRFVLFEGHPVEWLFDVDADGRWIATDYDYFGGAEASKGWAPEYIDRLSLPP